MFLTKAIPAVTIKALCDELSQDEGRNQVKLNQNFRRDGIALVKNIKDQLGA